MEGEAVEGTHPGSPDTALPVSAPKGTCTLAIPYELSRESLCILSPLLQLLSPQEQGGEGSCEHSSAPSSATAFPGVPQAEVTPSPTCLWRQMRGRIQERMISGMPSSNGIHFSGHQEFLIGVSGLLQGQQLSDALPQVLPRGKTEIRKNDNEKYYCLGFCSLEIDF